MSYALLQSALLLPAELLVNALLACDPLTPERLRACEGRTLEIHCTNPQLQLFVHVGAARLRFSPVAGTPADARLSGSASALVKLLGQGGAAHNLHGTGVSLDGSTALVAGLRETLLQLDVDWEYQLSRILGDLPARAMSQATATSSAALKHASAHWRDDLHAYLTQERALVPHRREVESSYAAVHALQLKLDRLQARIELLATSAEGAPE